MLYCYVNFVQKSLDRARKKIESSIVDSFFFCKRQLHCTENLGNLCKNIIYSFLWFIFLRFFCISFAPTYRSQMFNFYMQYF